MRGNFILNILCSIPVLLLIMYISPFLGTILLLFRLFIVTGKRKILTPIILICASVLIYLPKLLNMLFKYIKVDPKSIPYLSKIIQSNVYKTDFIKFAKYLLIIGIIFYLLSLIFNRIFNKFNSLTSGLTNGLREALEKEIENEKEIKRENDLKMQEKREIALNSHVVTCPYCGSDNLLTSTTGKCKYCRKNIS